MENQGLCGRHLLSFSPFMRPLDFFLRPKKAAPAMQATIQLKYISVFKNQFLTLFSEEISTEQMQKIYIDIRG